MTTTATLPTTTSADPTVPAITSAVPSPGPQQGAGRRPSAVPDGVPAAWLTATVRPAGTFGRRDVGRLRALLDALSACASIVVLDLRATRLSSPRAAAAIDEAAHRLEDHGGCLVCIHADADASARLAAAGRHAVVLAAG